MSYCKHPELWIMQDGTRQCSVCGAKWANDVNRLAFRAYACAYIMGTADQYDMDDDMEVANAGTNALRSHAIRVARAMLQAEKDEYGE